MENRICYKLACGVVCRQNYYYSFFFYSFRNLLSLSHVRCYLYVYFDVQEQLRVSEGFNPCITEL